MTRTTTLWSLLLLSAALALGSCTKDATEQATGPEPEAKAASKLVFSSENAVRGELLVCFGEEAVAGIESSVMQVTRSGGVATRSGIADFDAVLGSIGVKALQRLFPVDERNEERTRAAGLHRWYVVEFDAAADLDKAALDMARIAEVSKVEFNQQLMHVHEGRVIPLAETGAAIIQCSYGYPAGSVTSDAAYSSGASAEKQAIDYFIAKQNCAAIEGGLAIFAAGNDMTGMSSYPGAYRDYISVTAMSCDYTPAYYTNYGPGCNIAAPGGDAYQSYLENINTGASEVLSTVNGGKYGYMQGTSMACPHVSGVAALGLSYALQLGKTFTQNEFTTLLLTSVNDINQYCTGTKQYFTDKGSLATLDLSQYKKGMGTGYIDAYQVLMNVRGITCIPIPVGSQYTLNLQPYLGGGNLDLKITEISISAEDMNRLGISANPTIFANQIILKCTKPGSAVVRIKLLAGNGNNSGMNGMPITKEFAFIAREVHSQNGGWL